MSLFISGLAFHDPIYDMEAKIGILMASAIAGVLGFLIIKKQTKKQRRLSDISLLIHFGI